MPSGMIGNDERRYRGGGGGTATPTPPPMGRDVGPGEPGGPSMFQRGVGKEGMTGQAPNMLAGGSFGAPGGGTPPPSQGSPNPQGSMDLMRMIAGMMGMSNGQQGAAPSGAQRFRGGTPGGGMPGGGQNTDMMAQLLNAIMAGRQGGRQGGGPPSITAPNMGIGGGTSPNITAPNMQPRQGAWNPNMGFSGAPPPDEPNTIKNTPRISMPGFSDPTGRGSY